MSPIGPDPHPGVTDPDRVVDLLKEVGQELHSTPSSPPPVPTPTGTQVFSITATVFSVGRGAVSLRSPDPTVFESPDAGIVITGLTTNMLRQFTVGQVYSIVVSTTP